MAAKTEKYVSIEGEYLRHSTKAVYVKLEGNKLRWFPFSQIKNGRELYESLAEGSCDGEILEFEASEWIVGLMKI